MDIFSAISWGATIATGLVLVLVEVRLLRQRTIRQQRFAVVALFGIQLASIVAYYSAWWHRLAGNPVTKNLLWPTSDYLVRHLMVDLWSLVTAWGVGVIILLGGGWYFVRRGGGKMLDSTDIGVIFLASVAVGWPSVFILLGLTFVVAVVLLLVLVLLRKKSVHDRLTISRAIIPAAIITLAFQERLLAITHLANIGF